MERTFINSPTGSTVDSTPGRGVQSADRSSTARQFAQAQKYARIATWTVDLISGRHEWSDGFRELIGLDPHCEASLEQALAQLVPEEAEKLSRLLGNAYATATPLETEFHHLVGGERIFALSVAFPAEQGEAPQYAVGVVQDVTESRRNRDALRRRAEQQSALSNLSQLALSGVSLELLLDRATVMICDLTDVNAVETLKVSETGFELATRSMCSKAGAPLAAEDAPLTTSSLANFVVRWNEPLLVGDLRTEERFEVSSIVLERALVSGAFVPIMLSSGIHWGILAVYARDCSGPIDHEIDFVRTVAAILSQAIARLEADVENRQRVRRQSALAALGRLTLTSLEEDVYERACEIARNGINADYAIYGELHEGVTLEIVAGTPWTDQLPRRVPMTPRTQFGATILENAPVVVNDYGSDVHFQSFALTVPFGIRSGAMVPVASRGTTFGVLSVQSRRRNAFGREDVAFLEAVAKMLAEAIDREKWFRAVELSESRQRQILDGASETIFTVAADGCFVDLNPAFESATGWTREEWLGRPFIELICESDRPAVLKRFAEIIELNAPRGMEMLAMGKHRVVQFDVKSFPRVENGVVLEIYGFARDITEERRATRDREELTRSLQLLLESTVEGIFTLDLEGRCTMVNHAACILLGRDRNELIGENLHRMLHPPRGEAAAAEHRDCALQTKSDQWFAGNVSNQRVWKKDGTSFPVDYSIAPIIDDGTVVGSVLTFTDITQRLALESKLAQANRLSDLGKLAAVVAHEFNNVLMGISPFVEILKRNPSPEKIQIAHSQIMASIRRGRRITTDILRFTQPNEPLFTTFDVAGWLDSVVREATSVLGDCYTVEVSGESADLRLTGDAGQLQQVLMNLIINARDAMPKGGKLSLSTRHEGAEFTFPFGYVRNPDRHLHIALTDTGCGMSRETIDRIFEPLFTSKRNGTGLGLPITQSIVERHGGQIFVESAVDAGTTFHIFLPLALEEAKTTSEESVTAPPLQSEGRRILLVEDDDGVAEGLSSLLEAEGFLVTLAPTGAQAIEMARADLPDAVVLDIGLPDMDGREVFQHLMRIDERLPVIFSTGHGERESVEELMSSGAVDFLLKPYEAGALFETLSRVTARR